MKPAWLLIDGVSSINFASEDLRKTCQLLSILPPPKTTPREVLQQVTGIKLK
jgi:hypothetical protein